MSNFKEVAESLCEKDRLILGEWAWGEIDFYLVKLKKAGDSLAAKRLLGVMSGKWDMKRGHTPIPTLLDIAVACLGKKEIEKRLKDLSP